MNVPVRNVNLVSVIKPLYYLSKVLGLASFSLYKRGGESRDTFLNSGAWFSCLWVVICAVHLCFQIHNIVHSTEIPLKNIITHTLYYLSLYSMNIISLCLCNIFNRRQIPEIIEQIEQLKKIFITKVHTNIVHKKVRNFVLFETIVLLTVLVNSVTYITYIYFTHNPSILTSYFTTFEAFVCMSNSVMIIQFVNVVMFLRHTCNCISNEVGICCDIIEDRYRYSTIRSYPGGLSVFRSRSAKMADYLWDQIHDLRIAYSRLCTVTRKANSYYGLPILLSVSWLFLSIVLVLSSALFSFINSSNTDSTLERYGSFYHNLWYCIYCGILITIVTMSCHLVGKETDNIMFHIQKLLLKYDLGNKIEKELNQFCCQLNYLKLEFSACGLFTLNLRFLNTFLSMSLAYFVITFQWK
jgi:hypothetical protein